MSRHVKVATRLAYRKKVCIASWKAVMGQMASGKAEMTWAAGRWEAGSSGGGQSADRAGRRLDWPRRKRCQRHCQVRSERWQSATGAKPPGPGIIMPSAIV